MQLKITPLSVIVTLAAVVLVGAVGSHFSMLNRDWYELLNKPSWQPPDWAFGVAWTTIFILSAISIILVWNTRPQTDTTYWFIGMFVVNGVLNILWSALFFGNRMVQPAVWDAGLLFLSVVLLIMMAWQISRIAALLLIPYALWTAFATILTQSIYTLNH